jgi:hypothetical protein
MKKHTCLVFCAAAGMLAGCAMNASRKALPSASYGDSSRDVSAASGMTPEARKQQNFQRKIIRNARLDVEVRDMETAVEKTSAIVVEQNGFVENRSDYGNGKRVSFTLRVPEESLDAVLNELETLGSVTTRRIDSRDMTTEYVDIGARLQNLTVLRDRMKALLDKAEAISDILEIERELARVQTEMDSIESRMKRIDDQVSFSTINLSFERKPVLGPLGFVGKWMIRGVGCLFIIRD